ncbi:MAG: PP2C family protein-serine/threonine phosphatase, partial [Candidatus Sumerlaeota bacterium]
FVGLLRTMEDDCGDGLWSKELGDSRYAFMILDAMGHGPAAAIALGEFVHVIEELPLLDLQATIAVVNARYMALPHFVTGETPFVTGLLLVVDESSGTLEAICFGHPGLIFTPTGCHEIPGGAPVGLIEGCDVWPVRRLLLRALGSRILAYTDGVIEQFNARGSMYGMDNLAQNFASTSWLPLTTSLETILHNMDRWRGGAALMDDQGLLGIEFHG